MNVALARLDNLILLFDTEIMQEHKNNKNWVDREFKSWTRRENAEMKNAEVFVFTIDLRKIVK